MDTLLYTAQLRLQFSTIFSQRFSISIDHGWQKLIKQMLEEIMLQPDHNLIQITQIKQKFGALRVYFDGVASDIIKQIIKRTEEKASHTCEFCGCNTARLAWIGRWQMVCCESCEVEKKPPESSSDDEDDDLD